MNNLKLISGDTDGLALIKIDQSKFSLEEITQIIQSINDSLPEMVNFEDEGVLKKQLVVKTKNYVMLKDKKQLKSGDRELIIKGAALKATSKEKALRRFIREIIDLLLKDRKDQIYCTYTKYANDIVRLKSIEDWCSKYTVTKSVLNPERTNERRKLDALEGSSYREGDKVYMFFRTETELCLRENFDGTYCTDTLLGKLYDTLKVFDTIVDIECFPNYSLKRNRSLLETPTSPTIFKTTPSLFDLVTR